jgi:integrase
MPIAKLTKRAIDALVPKAKRCTWWDTEISGFGLRLTPGGEGTYVLKYRFDHAQRWFTIGRHGSPWTPESARRQAFRILGDVARGIDPALQKQGGREAITFGELCDLYLAEGVTHKKASTIRADRGRIEHHLKPLIGKRRVKSIGRDDVERLLVDVANGRTAKVLEPGERPPGSTPTGGKGVAARCVELLGTLFAFAVARKLRTDNPARGVKRPKSRKHERFLSEAEIARLATALDEETRRSGPFPSTAIKLLMLTGCRRSEILHLQWPHVDFTQQCLRLPDSKTGAKVVYLNAPALALLQELPRLECNPHVIAGDRQGAHLIGIDKIWFRIRGNAGLADVRLHDLRHSFASIGAIGGLSLPVIGALLGHKHTATTARYAHLSADPLRAANEAVGARIAAAMKQPMGTEVVRLKQTS